MKEAGNTSLGIDSGLGKLLSLLTCLLLLQASAMAREYKLALPGYSMSFPADHASHDDFKTEWWYYTGHLKGEDGTRYGYELTFFRSAMDVPKPIEPSVWSVHNVYLAHFAITDISGSRFNYNMKMNRSGPGFAGADKTHYYVWNQNWRASLTAGDEHKLVASDGEYKIDLTLSSAKPPALHGKNGLSQKASCRGCASHYYSLTRLITNGVLSHKGKSTKVTGTSWMDHEFGSNQLTEDQIGWDWFSVQLDNDTELMLYLMRRRDKSFDENSSGTLVFADGSTRHLSLNDYTVTARNTWKSPRSNAEYPLGWHVSIPAAKLEIEITPELTDQELTKKSENDVTYWEGACSVQGKIADKQVNGQAYVEMTGYAERFNKGI